MTRRKREEVTWFTPVVVKYILHINCPNGQYSTAVVVIRKGSPTRKHSSAIARLTMYRFVTEIGRAHV